MFYDTIVIGAGLAGLMGALRLAEAGQRVLLLAKGHGATHWAPGTIDVLGDERPRAALLRLIAERPSHPYGRAGLPALEAALLRLRELGAEAGYRFVGSLDRSLLVPTAAGALRPTAMLPASMAAADMRIAGPILVAGLRGLQDFFAPMVAANLRAQGFSARAATLELPAGLRRRDLPAVVLAELFERPEAIDAIGAQLRALRGDARRIGLPAVLGLQRASEVVALLQEASGALIFEIAGLPPSIPGMRLFQLLAGALRRAGGSIQLGGWVSGYQAEGQRVRAVLSEAAARTQRHQADAFLLATGGIAGGGLRVAADGTLHETALGLPVGAPAPGPAGQISARFLAEHGHPIYQAGVVVDELLRPLDQQGQLVYENVVVAGAALAGADLIRERAYEGVALATGWRAAENLLNML